MINYNKIKDAVSREVNSGEIISTREIVEAVQKYYPEVPQGSILPCDYCDNWHNRDPYSGRHHIFNRIKKGSYKVL